MRLLTCAIVLGGLSTLAPAAEPPPVPTQPSAAASRAQAITPFIDEQTIAVGWIEPGRVNLEPVEALLVDLVSNFGSPDDRKGVLLGLGVMEVTAKTWLESFKTAGGVDVYLVGSPVDWVEMAQPFIVAPLGPNANVRALAGLLCSGRPNGPTSRPAPNPDRPGPAGILTEQVGSAVVAAAPSTIARLKELKPAVRPEIRQAFEAVEGAPDQIIIIPTHDTWRVIEDHFPTLPPQFGGGPTTAISRNVLWAAAGVRTKPVLSASVVIQARDATAAHVLAGVVDQVIEGIINSPDIPEEFHLPLKNALAVLRPAVKDDRLVLELDAQTLRKAAARMSREMAATLLPKLIKAAIGHASQHEGEWPKDLSDLADSDALRKVTRDSSGTIRSIETIEPSGCVYIRPSQPASQVEPTRLVMYTAYSKWGDGVTVAFADGHVKSIADEAEFKKMLAEALAKGTATGSPATRPAKAK